MRKLNDGTALARLRPKQAEGLKHLLEAGSVPTAAKLTGVTERTLRRWQADATFRAAWAELTREGLRGSLGAMGAAGAVSIAFLRQVVEDVEASKALRVQAASVLAQFSLRAAEIDVGERISQLEEVLAERDAVDVATRGNGGSW